MRTAWLDGRVVGSTLPPSALRRSSLEVLPHEDRQPFALARCLALRSVLVVVHPRERPAVAPSDKGLAGDGDTAAAAAPDKNPDGVPYPTENIGTTARSGDTAGNTIQNYKFLGYPDGDTSQRPPADLDGPRSSTRPGAKYKLIHIQASGTWCIYCKAGDEDRRPDEARSSTRRKVVWIISLAEGPTPGTAADHEGPRPVDRAVQGAVHALARPGQQEPRPVLRRAPRSPGTRTSTRRRWRSSTSGVGAATNEQRHPRGSMDGWLAKIDRARSSESVRARRRRARLRARASAARGRSAPAAAPTTPASQRGARRRGASASDFSARDIDGKTVKLSSYLGKQVILLNFCATWCEPCVAEFPHLRRMYEANKDKGFVILGIAMDGPETVANVAGVREAQPAQLSRPARRGLAHRVALQPEEVGAALGPDRQAPGRSSSIREGYNPGDEEFLAQGRREGRSTEPPRRK